MSRVNSERTRNRRASCCLFTGFACTFLGILLLDGLLGELPMGVAQEIGVMPRLAIPDKTPDVLTPGIRQDAIIMRSSMGESVLVPKSQYEDFENFLNAKNLLPTTNADDALERMELEVAIEASVAKIQVKAVANLSDENRSWVRIPIGLGGLQPVPVRDSASGAVEFPPIRVSKDNSGYLWRIAPSDAGVKELRFEGLAKVQRLQQGYSLRLDLPLVQTVVRLELPLGQWDLNAVGNGSEIAEPFQTTDAKSVALVRTSGGTLTLSWTKKASVEQVQAIEVDSNTKYLPLMETGEFRAVSNLMIRGPKTLGGRRFLIALPPRSQWREPIASSLQFPGYRLSRTETSDSANGSILVLEFEEAFSRTEMELSIEWQCSNPPESNRMDFSMLKIEGVQRHDGNVEIAVPRNVAFRWDPQRSIQFARQTQSNDGSDTLLYAFRFQQQNEPLKVDWSVGDRTSDLKAIYSVAVEGAVLRLNGNIEILGDVRSLPFLQLDVRDWTVDRVQLQPSGRDLDLIAIRSRSSSEAGGAQQNTTSIPLSLGELLDAIQTKAGPINTARSNDAMPSSTDSGTSSQTVRDDNVRQPTRSIAIVLSRSLSQAGQAGDTDALKQDFGFSLPMLSWLDPESQSRQSLSIGGELSIQSTTSELECATAKSEWFQELIEPATAIRRPGLKYRFSKAKNWIEWNGSYETRGANMDASAQTRVVVGPKEVEWIQTWQMMSTAGRVKKLRIAIPKDWLREPTAKQDNPDAMEAVRITVDGAPVTLSPLANDNEIRTLPFVAASFEDRYRWYQVDLPASQRTNELGRERQVVVRTKTNLKEPLSSSEIAVDWSLPWIAEDNPLDSVVVGKFTGDVVHSDEIRCHLHSPLGGTEEPISLNENEMTRVSFDRTGMEPRLLGSISLPTMPKPELVDIESVWLQTIVNAIEQRDRYVIRLKTRGRVLTLGLPSHRLANAEFIVDGRKSIPTRNDVNLVELRLDAPELDASASVEQSYVLEVFVWYGNKSQWLKTLNAEPLSISYSTSKAPFAWQVVVPSTVHVIGNTSTLSAGYHWKWQDLWFGRKSEWNQDDIGRYMGATPQPFVSQQTNQYVYFSLDHTAPMSVATAPRYLLWVPVALFVLVCSFSVMEFRWIRRPWILVVMLLLGLAFSQFAWDLSIALAQCLVVATCIAVMYSMLKWSVDRRARRRSVFASRPSSPLILTAGRSNPSGPALGAKTPLLVGQNGNKPSGPESPMSTTHSPAGEGGQ